MGKKVESSSDSSSSSSESEVDATNRNLVTPNPEKTPSKKSSSSSKRKSSSASASSKGSSSKGGKKEDLAKYYSNLIEPYKKCEVQTMSKLERLVKQSEQGQGKDGGMGDAVAKTENIRNWKEHTMEQEKLAA
jgi:hypothetical protein